MSTTRIKLWYLIGNLEVGGTERTLVDLVNNIDLEQFDVTIWTLENSNPLASELKESVRLCSLNAAGKVDLRLPARFSHAVYIENPDILQSFLFYDNTMATIAGKFGKNTTIITGIRAVPNESGMIRRYVRSSIHPQADYVVSNSEAGARFIADQGVSNSKINVIRNGRHLDKYATGNRTDILYKELDIEREQPVVGTVGRLIERKGHLDLIKAWSKVLTSYQDAQLLIVGSGPQIDRLQNKTANIECDDSIFFLGHRDDIPDLLELLDVFVFPSHFEGLPGALLEAMAAGLPIVTTPVDGNRELIKHNEHGIYVPPHSPTELADGIKMLLDNQSLASQLGKRAKKRAFSEFTIENMVSKFEYLYKTSQNK